MDHICNTMWCNWRCGHIVLAHYCISRITCIIFLGIRKVFWFWCNNHIIKNRGVRGLNVKKKRSKHWKAIFTVICFHVLILKQFSVTTASEVISVRIVWRRVDVQTGNRSLVVEIAPEEENYIKNKTRSLFVRTDNVSVTISEDNTQKCGKYGNGSTMGYPSQKDEITKGMWANIVFVFLTKPLSAVL